MLGLSYLLQPVTTDDFWDRYWGRQALLVRGGVDKFPDLFGWEALNGLLNEGQTSPNSIRLVHDRKSVPPQEAAHVARWLKKGATLIVNHLHRADPMVGRLSDSIARDLNTAINTNCYSSWPVSQGFDMHYDGHDVYVVNVEGRKAWKVFEPTLVHPLERHARSRGEPPRDASPYLECVLDVGDVLYIPRGHWHYAVAETPSMHLTLGAQPRTGVDFLEWLTLQMADNDEEMRRDFALGRMVELGGDGAGLLDRDIERFAARVREAFEPESLRESLLRYAMLNNPARRAFQLPELPDFDARLAEDTRLVTTPNQKVILRNSPDEDLVLVIARGRRVEISGLAIDGLRRLFDAREPWQPREWFGDSVAWEVLSEALGALFDHDLVRLA